MTSGLCFSWSPKLSFFYSFIDVTPWQVPQPGLAQRAAAHRGLPLNTAATKSAPGTGVVVCHCLCCPTPLPTARTPLAAFEPGGGCTSDPALWSVLIDLLPSC